MTTVEELQKKIEVLEYVLASNLQAIKMALLSLDENGKLDEPERKFFRGEFGKKT